MNYVLAIIAAVLLIVGLAGNGFEMRKIRTSSTRDEEMASKNAFLNKKNLKWYVLIGIALVLWLIGNSST